MTTSKYDYIRFGIDAVDKTIYRDCTNEILILLAADKLISSSLEVLYELIRNDETGDNRELLRYRYYNHLNSALIKLRNNTAVKIADRVRVDYLYEMDTLVRFLAGEYVITVSGVNTSLDRIIIPRPLTEYTVEDKIRISDKVTHIKSVFDRIVLKGFYKGQEFFQQGDITTAVKMLRKDLREIAKERPLVKW